MKPSNDDVTYWMGSVSRLRSLDEKVECDYCGCMMDGISEKCSNRSITRMWKCSNCGMTTKEIGSCEQEKACD